MKSCLTTMIIKLRSYWNKWAFYLCILCWIPTLIAIDRYFFKANASFCLRFIYSTMPNNSRWDLPPLKKEQSQWLDQILEQPFFYLAKGAHCYAFISQDKNYVIKLHRYPSHMRPLPWLTHPFAYRFSKRRKQIKEYNLTQYAYMMDNYKTSFEELKEETATLLVHINRTDYLNKKVHLVDKTGNHYSVSLDKITFILQRKAELIYPTLERLLKQGLEQNAKEVICQILQLIAHTAQKGFINNDPILYRNYGLLPDRAIYIDLGDLVKEKQINAAATQLSKITGSLRAWLELHYPQLLDYYDTQVTLYSKTL